MALLHVSFEALFEVCREAASQSIRCCEQLSLVVDVSQISHQLDASLLLVDPSVRFPARERCLRTMLPLRKVTLFAKEPCKADMGIHGVRAQRLTKIRELT